MYKFKHGLTAPPAIYRTLWPDHPPGICHVSSLRDPFTACVAAFADTAHPTIFKHWRGVLWLRLYSGVDNPLAECKVAPKLLPRRKGLYETTVDAVARAAPSTTSLTETTGG